MKYYYGYIVDDYGFIVEDDPRSKEGLIEISEEEHDNLLEEQTNGKEIVYFEGKVFVTERGQYYVDENNNWQKYSDDEISEKQTTELIIAQNYQARKFLNNTDWQVARHRDQLAMGIEPSLTEEKYQELLLQRQQARDSVVEVENDITN